MDIKMWSGRSNLRSRQPARQSRPNQCIGQPGQALPSVKIQLVWLLVLLLAWESVSRAGLVNPLIVPPVSAVLRRLVTGLWGGTLFLQWVQSVSLVVAGLLVGSLIGFFLATADYFLPRIRPVITLLNAVLHPLPGVAILPVVLSIAGLGLPAVSIVILHAIVWSAYLSFISGFRSIAPELLDIARNLGASRRQILYHVLLPSIGPQLAAGLRIGWSRGWRALISAEMIFSAIGSLGGLGWYLFERRSFMDITGVYAGIVLMILTGFFIESVVFRRWLPGQADTN